MKNILLLVLAMGLFSCGGNSDANTSDDNVTLVPRFLDDIESLEKITGKNPIVLFQSKAENEADKVMEFDKGEMNEVLELAGEFKHCVITTGDHTIVKIVDLEDCQQSGSWGSCMPKVEGYIKKGDLVSQDDYLNNIIGLPDDQERKAYFFN